MSDLIRDYLALPQVAFLMEHWIAILILNVVGWAFVFIVQRRRYRCLLLFFLPFLLSGCANLPFKNPLFTVTFGPLLTVNVGEKNDTREIHAYGDEMAHQAISSATEAISIQVPAPAAEKGDTLDSSQPPSRSRNLW